MNFRMWKTKVWQASTRIKKYLKMFFSKLLRGKLGSNTLYGPEAVAEAGHQMLCTEANLSSTARSMGLAPTTLTRKLQLVSRGEVWEALSSVMDSLMEVEENLLVADFTHLGLHGEESAEVHYGHQARLSVQGFGGGHRQGDMLPGSHLYAGLQRRTVA